MCFSLCNWHCLWKTRIILKVVGIWPGGIWKDCWPTKFHQLVELVLYGWIAGGWEAHFRNYRHFVSQCPVSTLDWLPNFPHKAWVDPGEGSFKWIALSGNRTVIACVAIEIHDHYTTAPTLVGGWVSRCGVMKLLIFYSIKFYFLLSNENHWHKSRTTEDPT